LKKFKKILSILLSVVIASSVFSVTASTAFAEQKQSAEIDIFNSFEAPAEFFAEGRASVKKANLDYIKVKHAAAVKALANGFSQFSREIALDSYNLSLADLNNIMAYLKYYEQYYYLAGSYSYAMYPDGQIAYCKPSYTMPKDQVIAGNRIIKQKTDALVSEASKLKTDIEKIIYVHDYIIENFEYDSDHLDQKYNNIYYGLVENKTMCVGYSETFNYIMTRLGIKSYIVTSVKNAHAWNMVLLDGRYYHVDCTWDDPTYTNTNLMANPLSGNFLYENLMGSDSVMAKTGHDFNDWEVNGYNVYGYADSSLYNDFFWRDFSERIVYAGGYWYLAYPKQFEDKAHINLADVGFYIDEIQFTSNSKYTRRQVREVLTAYMIDENRGYQDFYPNLQSYDDELYYKTSKGIYLYNPSSETDSVVFASKRSDNIYDFVINGENQTFSIIYGVHPEDRGVVITYNIKDYFCKLYGHNYVWKTVNNYQVNLCGKCGEEVMRLQFVDLKGYEIYDDYIVYTSVNNKFISGTNPPQYTLFSPKTPITRAMLVAILYRMAGNPYDNSNPHTENPFTDIQPGVYYYNAACWALDEGITNQTTFKPNDNVTREQTARFLFAYAEANDMLVDAAYKNVNLAKYPDYGSVHEWAREPLQWANYNNMITGTQQGYINPQGATQRIHATRILYGFGKVCNIGNFS